MGRLILGLVVLVAALAVTALAAHLRGASDSALLPPKLAQRVDRIAYVDLAGQVRAIRLDSADEWQVSQGDGFFTWPTWSPDGQRIAYSGVLRQDDGRLGLGLYAFDAASRMRREIYTSVFNTPVLLAPGVVHYSLWSPDSARIAFVAGTSRGLTLFLHDTGPDSEAEQVLDSGPLWMSWSPDSRNILVHRGLGHYLVRVADTGEVNVSGLGIVSGGYRVPAWKPFSETVTLASVNRTDSYTIYEAELTASGLDGLQPIAEAARSPVFLWSPDGEFLAVGSASTILAYQGLDLLVYRGLKLLPSGIGGEPIDVFGNILAFFWSPDSSKLALVTLSETLGVLRWMVFDIESGQLFRVVDFIPSSDQLVLFQFFDQYAYSHSLWSPDSNALVFSGSLSSEAVSASYHAHPGHAGPHVIVVEAAPDAPARFVADGFMAFWSPR